MNKLGQLFITGIKGITLDPEERDFLKKEKIGGVILFASNFESPAQMAELVNSIQELNKNVPFFVSVDHEGGRVLRFKPHLTHFPAMLKVASLNSPKICYEIHEIMAKELQVCGINLNFSPVCDIFTNEQNRVIGDRAFGRDAATVEKFVSSAIRGLQTNGVIGCAKHFPGHGDTLKDSHFELPFVKTKLETLKAREFLPFIKAIKNKVEIIMTAHILMDEIDDKTPATFSKKIINILREDLGYKNLIITDDMEMKAVTKNFGIEQAAVMALNAGCDILLYRSVEYARRALSGVRMAVDNQQISSKIINKKIDMVLDCKKRMIPDFNKIYIPDLENKLKEINGKEYLANLLKKLQTV